MQPVTFAVKVVVPPAQILNAPEMETEAAAGAEIVTSSLEDAKVSPCKKAKAVTSASALNAFKHTLIF